ncbi:MAG: hypothetical protein WCR52_22910, partial [Bacteroidota bacterium]
GLIVLKTGQQAKKAFRALPSELRAELLKKFVSAVGLEPTTPSVVMKYLFSTTPVFLKNHLPSKNPEGIICL